MAIRKYKPTTPGRRGSSVSDFAEITRSEPEKSLVRPLHGKGGRNAHGRSSDFSGVERVISAKSETLAPRRPGVVGLYLRIPMVCPGSLCSRSAG